MHHCRRLPLSDPVSPEPQIRLFDRVYTHHGKTEKAVPPGEFSIGELQGITHNTQEPPSENYHGTNLEARYAGQPILHVDREVWLWDEDGYYLVFTLDKGQSEPEYSHIQICFEGRDYFYTDWYADELPELAQRIGTLEHSVLGPWEVPEGSFAGINVPYYLLDAEVWKLANRLYLDDSKGGYWVFQSSLEEDVVTELMRGDFDNDGREDYLEAVMTAPNNEAVTVNLRDAETGEVLWSDWLNTGGEQKMLTYCRSESLGNYFVRDSYDAAYDCLRCRRFTIEDGKEKVIRQWEVEMPRFPDVPTEADFALAMIMSLPANSTVLASTLGGLLLTGPFSGKDKLGYSEATEIFSGDFDHDGEDEIIVAAPDPIHTTLWHLYMEEQDGTVIWLEQDFATAHAGWKCILAYEDADGLDYLIRYDPAMFQGIANYRCEQFYIKDGKEVLQNKWNAEFEIPTAMTSEMEEFAAEMESLLSRSYLLLSTLDGELKIGPTRGDVAGLLPVDYGFSDEMEAWEYFCKGAMADLMAAEASHYTWNIYIDGVLRTDMPRNEGWFFADSWFQHSELLSDGRSYESVFLEKDGVQYAWSRIDGREQLLTSDSGEYDAYGRSVFDTWLNYDLEFVSKTETDNGLELVFEALWEGENPTNGQQTFIFDENERLAEARFESDVPYTDAYGTPSTVRTVRQTIVIAFPKVSEAMCRQMIEEAYAELMAAQKTAEATSADTIIDDGSSYPLAIPYGKTVVTDLDGDGVTEKVCQTVNSGGYRIESFTVNGVEYIDDVREKCGPFENTEADYYKYWYITDILESDGHLEISVYDGGPSGDPKTHFYLYSGDGLMYTGTVPSPAAELKYDGKGYITGPARLAVFQTWFAEHTWSIFGPGRMIRSEPREFYEVDFRFRDYTIGMDYFPGADTNPLLQEILAYKAADKASESWTLPKGTQIGLLGTDNREWLFATADGEECWLHFEGTSLDAPGGLMRDASKVLNGLHYYD